MSLLPERHRQVVEYLNQRQPQQAIDLLQGLVAERPESGELWDHLLAAYAMTEQYEEAEQAYLRCEQLGTLYPETLINAAHNARLWGRSDRLLYYGDQLMERFPEEHIIGLQFRTDALWQQRKYAESLLACEEILQLQPEKISA
ncbi:MAG: hypothetical protein HQL48_10110 [Gammaproteobacteria bacterium]|nr:hypothetical protein [Gammaproteobacteria bacterium]